MAMDIGAFTPMLHGLRERETINDLIEALCGARLTYNYHRIGGVAFDLPEGWRDRTPRLPRPLRPLPDEFDRLISFNEIYVKRLADVAVIPEAMARDYGLVGPEPARLGRGLGPPPRHALRRLPRASSFEVPVGQGILRHGRRLLRPLLRPLPGDGRVVEDRAAGPRHRCPTASTWPRSRGSIKPEAGEALSRVESARGEMAYYVVSDGTEKAYRVRARTGSFTAMGIIEAISPGLMVADLVALIASLDVVAPEIDR